MKGPCTFFCVLTALFFYSFSVKATHNRSGEILYYKVPGAYTYSIVVIKYTADGPNIADRCEDTVHFGDGSKGVLKRINGNSCISCTSSKCGQVISTQSDYRVKKNVYSIVHTFPGPGSYLLRSVDANRSDGSENLPNSVNIEFYIESLLLIHSSDSQNSSPQLSRPPIDQGVVNSCFNHNPCAFDPDGDSLSFELTSCRGADGKTVPGYTLPGSDSGETFKMDSETGLITWCIPKITGIYNIAYKVIEWRRQDCQSPYSQKGYVMRDMELVINAAPLKTFDTTPLGDTCVVAGEVLKRTFTAVSSGTNISSYKLEVLGSSVSPFSGAPAASLNTVTIKTGMVATLTWSTTCAHYQPGYHYVHVLLTENFYQLSLTRYKTFRVKVFPPPAPVVDVAYTNNNATVTWTNLQGCKKVKGYNVYRSTSDSLAAPVSCKDGLPANAGYVLVASRSENLTDTVYTDTGIASLPGTTKPKYLVVPVMENCFDNGTLEPLQTVTGQFLVFPNPTEAGFTIKFPPHDNEPVNVAIYAMDGKVLFKNTFEKETEVNIENPSLSSGIYIVEVVAGDSTFRSKLLRK